LLIRGRGAAGPGGETLVHTATGKVADDFYVTGTPEVHGYLLDGDQPVIFDAGFAAFGAAYRRDIDRILGHRRPHTLLLTHVHFDHCGAARYLQRAYPGMQVAASARAADILRRPGALELMDRLNRQAGELARQWHPDLPEYPVFEPFAVDRVLADGEVIELAGGLTIEVIATPGHTWDFLSYYIPQRRILVASEAVGCPDFTSDHIVTEFLVDYQAYVDSMARLARLEVEVLCPGHGMVMTGRHAADFIARSQVAAGEFKDRIAVLLAEEGFDLERTVARYKAEEWDRQPYPKQPEPAYLLNLTARVRHLAELLPKA